VDATDFEERKGYEYENENENENGNENETEWILSNLSKSHNAFNALLKIWTCVIRKYMLCKVTVILDCVMEH
jgi:hypothetical protein